MKQSQKGCLIIAVPMAAIIIFTGIYLASKEEPSSEHKDIHLVERGYTKSDDKYRLFVFSYTADDTLAEKKIKAELSRHAKNRMHTPGRTTTIYYYEGKHPPERTFGTTEQHRRFLDQYAAPAAVFMIMQDGSLQAM